MKTAVVYARNSSTNQTEQSIEGQIHVCEDFAKRNNILIVDHYIDRAMSGTNDNRDAFQQMLKDSNNKKWDYVLVYKLDRFSRDKYQTTIHKHTLKQNGIKVLSAMENIPDSPEGLILESLLEGMNQYYSAELSQKVKRGMHETRLKGNFQGGTLPYGYKLDGRKIVIDDDKIEIVKYIFSQYANGKFVRQIIEDLTAKGIYKNGKPFATKTIYGMLSNEKYTGIYRKDNEVYDNMFPQIIDIETYNKVRARHKVNHYGKTSIKTTYLLRNKLVCGYCGKSISAESGTAKNGKKINYYKCIGIKKYRNGCIKETLRQEILEEFVLNSIIEELNNPKMINTIVKTLFELQKDTSLNTTLSILTKNKKQAEITLNNLLQAVEQGVVNKTTNSRMQELEKQIEDMERQILVEKSKINSKLTEEDIRKFYSEALKEEPITLINYIVKEIKLYNDKMEITFNTPTLKSPDKKGSLLLSKTKKMKKMIQNKPQPIMIEMQLDYYI